MKPNLGRLLIWGLIILVCSAFEVEAAVVTLAWDLSSSPNIAGYRLYSGTTSGVYSQTSELGNATSTLVSNLVTGKTYFFVVTAYNTMGVESARSNEVSYLAPPTTVPEQMVSPDTGFYLHFLQRDLELERWQRHGLFPFSGQLPQWQRYLQLWNSDGTFENREQYSN